MSERRHETGVGAVRARIARFPTAVATGIFVTATVGMFGDVLFSGSGRIPSIGAEDLARIFFYWNRFAFSELRQGHLVLWNPHSFAGAPFLAGFQPGLLYPPNWLHMLLPAALAINLGIALHFVLAGLWTHAWARFRGLHPAACVLAGLVFMFCGAHFLQLYRGHLPHLHTLVWIPLVLLAVDGVVETRDVRWILVGMAAVAMQVVAGNIQYALYTAIVAALYALGRWLAAGADARTALALIAIYAGGAMLAAAQLFPGLAAVPESLRAGLSYETASGGALPPENLLTLVLPGIFGDEIAVPYWGRWTLSETSLFIGVAPSLLALYGFVRGERRIAYPSLAMVVVALVFAFGDHTPLFRLLYAHLPGFRSVRGIAKFGILASAFLALLAAAGFDRLLRDARVARWLIVVAFAIGGMAGAAGIALRLDCETGGVGIWGPMLRSIAILADARRWFATEAGAAQGACTHTADSLLVGGATFALAGALLIASRRSQRLIYGVALLGVIEVMTYARYTRPTFDSAPLLAKATALRRALEEQAVLGSRIASGDPNQYVAMAAGGFDVWGSADLVLDRYARFLQFTQGWPLEAILVTSGLRHLNPRLDLLRLSHLLSVRNGQVTLRPTGLDVLPRALLVSDWRVVSDRDAVLTGMADPTFDPRRLALLETDPGITPGGGDQVGAVTVHDLSTEVLEVHAEVSRPALLVVTDNYAADWRATSIVGDGSEYEILPANYTLRAIPLRTGTHHIRLVYRPRAFVVGVWVSALSLALYALAVCVSLGRSRRSRAAGRA